MNTPVISPKGETAPDITPEVELILVARCMQDVLGRESQLRLIRDEAAELLAAEERQVAGVRAVFDYRARVCAGTASRREVCPPMPKAYAVEPVFFDFPEHCNL